MTLCDYIGFVISLVKNTLCIKASAWSNDIDDSDLLRYY